MLNSSLGQQEEEEEEEVGEGGGGAREQEFEQQDEEQMVKRRITVSRRPGSRMTSVMLRMDLHLEFGSYNVPMKVDTITVASEKRILRQAAFTEKVISTSLSDLRLPEQHFVLDSNEKKVKAGKSTREG